MVRSLSIAALLSVAHVVAAAPTAPVEDAITPPPAHFRAGAVEIREQLGAQAPLDLPLRTLDGALTTLGAAISGELPTILTFNYSNCPSLCSLQLSGLSGALPDVGWRLGKQFRIVTVVLDPAETPARATETRDRYVAALPPGSDPAGWQFLLAPEASATTRDDATIRRLADAVGFGYAYLPAQGSRPSEFAHPAALVLLSTEGRVMRYVHGATFVSAELEESIVRAGLGAPSTAVGFAYRCLHWDPDAASSAATGRLALRYAAAGFAALVFAVLLLVHVVRRPRPLVARGI